MQTAEMMVGKTTCGQKARQLAARETEWALFFRLRNDSGSRKNGLRRRKARSKANWTGSPDKTRPPSPCSVLRRRSGILTCPPGGGLMNALLFVAGRIPPTWSVDERKAGGWRLGTVQ